jgi:hypothetical protein
MKGTTAVVWTNGKAYFFKGSQYIRFDIANAQADDGYPLPIAGNWPGLEPFSDGIDAAVVWNNGKAYFFKGSQYIRYDIATDRADQAPLPILGNWRAAESYQEGIDAAVVWPNGKAYFFAGDHYFRFAIDASGQETLEDGPLPIKGNWPGVWSDGIDAVVAWNNGKGFIFRSSLYLTYDVATDRVESVDDAAVWVGLSPFYPRPTEPDSLIFTKWLRLGGVDYLGRPADDNFQPLPAPSSPSDPPPSRITQDGVGKFIHYENGSIFWKPSVGQHAVYGVIRKFWADHGWERNPELGYPISDDSPVGTSSKRFSDFENGVVMWFPGSPEAIKHEPLTQGDFASFSVDHIPGLLAKNVKPNLVPVVVPLPELSPYFPGFTLKSNVSDPALAPPGEVPLQDYSFDGWVVHNRNYHLKFSGSAVASNGDDIYMALLTVLDVELEVGHDPDLGMLANLRSGSIKTDVSPRAAALITADQVNELIKVKLATVIGEGIILFQNPQATNVLSIKVMPNGDLNVYLEPS